MKIYIAGKITGLHEAEAKRLFTEAATHLVRLGYTPLDPMAMVDQAPGRTYGELLHDALGILLTQAEAVYFLSNWHTSPGALIEHRIAEKLDMPIYYAPSIIPPVMEAAQ